MGAADCVRFANQIFVNIPLFRKRSIYRSGVVVLVPPGLRAPF